MIYLRPALYAEGPTDYRFLEPLINRLLREVMQRTFRSSSEIVNTRGIDSSLNEKRRIERITTAVREHEDLIDLLIIHADGAGDPAQSRSEQVEPGVEAARTAIPGKPLPALGCVPVRELEAWLLADRQVFREQFGLEVEPPASPERELDPKQTLDELLSSRRRRGRRRVDPYALFGEQVELERLRGLPAFAAFERELVEVLQRMWPGR